MKKKGSSAISAISKLFWVSDEDYEKDTSIETNTTEKPTQQSKTEDPQICPEQTDAVSAVTPASEQDVPNATLAGVEDNEIRDSLNKALADEIHVLRAHPGKIVSRINVDLPIERNRELKRSSSFMHLVHHVEDTMVDVQHFVEREQTEKRNSKTK